MNAHLIENAANLIAEESVHGEQFARVRRKFAAGLPDRKLGCSHLVVPPSKTAYPAHTHHSNDEALFIISGEGNLRYGQENHRVASGDFIYLPAGGPAHQMSNSGDTDLEYLCISTMIHPDVVEYPDSGKIGAFAGRAPGGDASFGNVVGFFPLNQQVDYFDGE